jgi:hypothetical protein
VLEIVALDDTATYRAVYTVRLADAIYVLHAFQKKSKKGIATPQKEIDLIKKRLADAERGRRYPWRQAAARLRPHARKVRQFLGWPVDGVSDRAWSGR